VATTTPFGSDGTWLKREDEHELGAFKWRGALAVLEAKRPDVVVTASTGNHGAATAWAARRAGARAVVFIPEEASAAKVALIEAQGAELHRGGADVDEAKEAARAYAAEQGAFFLRGRRRARAVRRLRGDRPGALDELPGAAGRRGRAGRKRSALRSASSAPSPRGAGRASRLWAEEAPAMWESWRAGPDGFPSAARRLPTGSQSGSRS
jgi:hypothetical protein